MNEQNVARPEYDAETVAQFEKVDAASLAFGDLMPYFGLHVRSITNDGHKIVVHFIKRLGIARERITFLQGDTVTVLRAGGAR